MAASSSWTWVDRTVQVSLTLLSLLNTHIVRRCCQTVFQDNRLWIDSCKWTPYFLEMSEIEMADNKLLGEKRRENAPRKTWFAQKTSLLLHTCKPLLNTTIFHQVFFFSNLIFLVLILTFLLKQTARTCAIAACTLHSQAVRTNGFPILNRCGWTTRWKLELPEIKGNVLPSAWLRNYDARE